MLVDKIYQIELGYKVYNNKLIETKDKLTCELNKCEYDNKVSHFIRLETCKFPLVFFHDKTMLIHEFASNAEEELVKLYLATYIRDIMESIYDTPMTFDSIEEQIKYNLRDIENKMISDVLSGTYKGKHK